MRWHILRIRPGHFHRKKYQFDAYVRFYARPARNENLIISACVVKYTENKRVDVSKLVLMIAARRWKVRQITPDEIQPRNGFI